uniref:GH10 domain-containing protein n=1 Tax=Hordeum vulgare subsp. vulgare TaxID=112509 RepID=A0A8I7BFK9_HORVV
MAGTQDASLITQNSTLEGGSLAGFAALGSRTTTLSVHDEEEMVAVTVGHGGDGNEPSGRYILVSGRADEKDGLRQVITGGVLKPGITYRVAGWISLVVAGAASRGTSHPVRVNLGVAMDDDESESLQVECGAVCAEAGGWTEIMGAFRLMTEQRSAAVYVHGAPAGVDVKVMDLRVVSVDREARFRQLKDKTDKHLIVLALLHQPLGLDRLRERAQVVPHRGAAGGSSTTPTPTRSSRSATAWTSASAATASSGPWKATCSSGSRAWTRTSSSLPSRATSRAWCPATLATSRITTSTTRCCTANSSGTVSETRTSRRSCSRRYANDFNVECGNDPNATPEKYAEQVAWLQSCGAVVRGIGLQGHVTSPVGEVICAALHRLATTGVPVWFTELDVSEPDVNLRAKDLEVVLREAYAHPAVEGIVLWGFMQGTMWLQDAWLVDANGTVNEAGQMFLNLQREWKTDVRGNADGDGNFNFRVFHGRYFVEVTTATGCRMLKTFTVEKGDNTPLLVDLGDG